MNTDPANGRLEHRADTPVLRFERNFAHPTERVWAALTEADELDHWFPTTISGSRRPGAELRFEFRPPMEHDGFDGELITFDPPRLFALTWGPSELWFGLEPTDAGCELQFSTSLDTIGVAARTAAGWHVCLDLLVAHVAGEDTQAPTDEPTPAWQAHYDHYRAEFGDAAASAPSEHVD
jgi:uncharacterized protein YndB with AHSA1/START domain